MYRNCYSAVILLTAAFAAFAQRPKPAEIRGTVKITGTAEPVAGAKVRIGALSGPMVSQTAETDQAGNFVVTDVTPGLYAVSAFKESFSSEPVIKGIYSSSRVLTLSNGETIQGLQLYLSRPGTLMGRVLDENHNPISGATVAPYVYRIVAGNPQLAQSAGSAETDARGDYQLSGLAPGRYAVRVILPRPISITKAPEDAATTGSAVFLPVFYPGVEDSSQAAMLRLQSGQVLSGLTITLPAGRVWDVPGTVDLPADRPIRSAILSATPEDGNPQDIRTTSVAANGTFRLRNLPKGRFRLELMVDYKDGGREGALDQLDVGGANPRPLRLTLAPSLRVKCRVKLPDGGDPQTFATVRPKLAKVSNVPYMTSIITGAPTETKNEFMLEGVPPGEFTPHLSDLPGGYHAARITYGPLEISAGSHLHPQAGAVLEFEVDNKAGTLSVEVEDGEGKPVAGAYVLVMGSAEYGKQPWSFGRQSDQHGEFQFQNLGPGSYTVYCFDAFSPELMRDTDFLRQYAAESIKIDGADKQIRIRVAHASL